MGAEQSSLLDSFGLCSVCKVKQGYEDTPNFDNVIQDRKLMAGVGIVVAATSGENTLTVESVAIGGPADEQGQGQIKGGDILVMVDGKEVTANSVIDLVRGAPGSAVTLRFKRPGGDEVYEMTLKRGFGKADHLDKAFGFGKKPSGLRTFMVL